MNKEIKYYKAFRGKNGGNDSFYMPEKNTPLAALELPTQLQEALNQPAIGRFPEFEKALNGQGVTLPVTWTVANFLSASCVGTTTEVRKDLGLPELEPQEVRLIYDDYHFGVAPTGSEEVGYNAMSYEVIFPDNKNFEGSVRMPGYYVNWCWGLPMYCARDTKSESIRGYQDHELFDAKKGQFTPNGLKLVNFIVNTITAGEKPSVNLRKPFGQMTREAASMSTLGHEFLEDEIRKEAKINARLIPVLDLFDEALKGTDINPNGIDEVNLKVLNEHLGLDPKDDLIQRIAGTGLQRMFAISDELHNKTITGLSDLDIQVIRFVNWYHQHPM